MEEIEWNRITLLGLHISLIWACFELELTEYIGGFLGQTGCFSYVKYYLLMKLYI